MKKKVIVAMSGGVDSSVAAALLKEKGFEVRGVFLYFWQDECSTKSENKCCSNESRKRAKKVAAVLGIPFYTLDFRKEFKKQVVDYFIDQYEKGFTPNPCIECNKKIKFGFLLDKIKASGGEYLATGHYVRNTEFRVKNLESEYKLFKARDKKKDQSYFLYNLDQEKLRNLLFPVGDYSKEEVRKIAKKFKLPTAKSKESQDVCFVENNGLEKFLRHYLKVKPGLILNTKGEKIGKHDGLPFYTIGQRKGIKIGGGKPYYVVKNDLRNNVLVVTDNPKDKELFRDKFEVTNINWILKGYAKNSKEIDILVRYRQKPVKASILRYDRKNNSCLVKFKEPQRAITPGQSAVFYNRDELLGGGIIKG